MRRVILGAASFAALTLAGCGRGEETPGQPSAEERRALDNIAARVEDEGTFDTSADSLVPVDDAATTGNGAVVPSGNADTTTNATGNGAAPRRP